MNNDATEYILDDDECPLSILMNHPTTRGKSENLINVKLFFKLLMSFNASLFSRYKLLHFSLLSPYTTVILLNFKIYNKMRFFLNNYKKVKSEKILIE